MTSWALQDAKARFSEVVERARRDGPQMVTKHGRSAVVVIDASQFQTLASGNSKDDLVSFFRKSPLRGIDPKLLKRSRDVGRPVVL